MRAIDCEPGRARREPCDAVLPVAGVIDRGRTTRRCKEAKLVQGHAIDRWKEDLAEGAIDKRVPQLALWTRRRPERHLASGTPHRGCSWASWCLHRALSMRSVHGG